MNLILYLILLIVFISVVFISFVAYITIYRSSEVLFQYSRGWLGAKLNEIFLFISPDKLFILKCLLAFICAIMIFIANINNSLILTLLITIFFGLLCFYIPDILIALLVIKRRKKFNKQLINGLNILSSTLRVGFSLPQAIEFLIAESKPPLAEEFFLIIKEYRLGIDLDQALKNCVERMKDLDLALIYIAISVTRQSGGNIIEIFDRIENMIRERMLFKNKAYSLTAQGRMQAIVLGLTPLCFALILIKINPEMIALMFSTKLGIISIFCVLILDLIGCIWVHKIANIKF